MRADSAKGQPLLDTRGRPFRARRCSLPVSSKFCWRESPRETQAARHPPASHGLGGLPFIFKFLNLGRPCVS